jgi:hypothetical protein
LCHFFLYHYLPLLASSMYHELLNCQGEFSLGANTVSAIATNHQVTTGTT